MAQEAWSVAGMIRTHTDDKVALQAVFPRPGIYTVQFGVDPGAGVGAAGMENMLEAEISWAVSGNTSIRKVTCVDGMSISGAAEGVSVKVYDKTIGGTAQEPYDISVQITKGARAATLAPYLFDRTYNVQIVAGGSYTFPIPNYGSASLADPPSPCGARAFQIQVYSVAGAVLVDQSIQALQQSGAGVLCGCDPRQLDWIPIHPGALSVWLKNNSAVSVKARLIWGIDG